MHAKYSLSNTQIGREVELTDDEVPALPSYNYGGWSGTSMEFFFMPAINVYDLAGNIIDSDRYDDLAVTFTFGDDDGLDATEFSGPDVINMKPATGSFSRFLFGFTVAEYAQTYSVRYPVIVRVWDPSTGESMNFATYVYMENNRVGMGCTAPPALPPADQNTDSETYNDRCTTGATEEATVTIKYDDDSAVSNALVSYAGCSMGLTDDLGKASGHVSREMFSSLTVEADGNEYSECHSYSDLDGMVMTIPRSASADVMFKRVKITKTGNTYTMMPPTPATSDEVITVEMTRNADICDGGTVVMMNLDDETGVFVTGKMLRNLPIDTYDVAISVQKEGAVLGFVTEAGFPHSPTIYVYAPSMEGFEDAEDLDAETANIEALYEHCGISPVSAVPYTTGVCQWTAA
jgi:hypothetical protein